MSFWDQMQGHLVTARETLTAHFGIIHAQLDQLIDAVKESTDDPTFEDIYKRATFLQLNGTQAIGQVPPGEIWIIDYVSASVAGWQVKVDAYTILWDTDKQIIEAPVILPGETVSIVTTALSDGIVQFTRKPLAKKGLTRAHSGENTEVINGTGPAHETQRDLIDTPSGIAH